MKWAWKHFGIIKLLQVDIVSNSHSIQPAQRMKFSIKGFFSKCDQIRRKLWIWSHLLKKSFMENFIFCAVSHPLTLLKLTLTRV